MWAGSVFDVIWELLLPQSGQLPAVSYSGPIECLGMEVMDGNIDQ
jgi:hypothetical protein